MAHEPKSEKYRPKVEIAKIVNVVSSVNILAGFKTAFEAGLNTGVATADQIQPVYTPSLGYGAALGQTISTFTNGLVVTLGGLISFVAAESNAATQFVSLIGGTPPLHGSPFPTPGTGLFFGAVSLESYAGDTGNPSRMQYLGTAPQAPRLTGNFAPGQICLLYNPNSVMNVVERAAWTAAGGAPPVPGGVDPNGNNSNQYYATAFGKIPQPAVVVSADPFFQHSKDALVHAANNSGKYICYPLRDYQNSTPPPLTGYATAYGPKLEDAHKQLGLIARSAITNGSAVTSIFRTPLGRPLDL